jgi:hypothetical protein
VGGELEVGVVPSLTSLHVKLCCYCLLSEERPGEARSHHSNGGASHRTSDFLARFSGMRDIPRADVTCVVMHSLR